MVAFHACRNMAWFGTMVNIWHGANVNTIIWLSALAICHIYVIICGRVPRVHLVLLLKIHNYCSRYLATLMTALYPIVLYALCYVICSFACIDTMPSCVTYVLVPKHCVTSMHGYHTSHWHVKVCTPPVCMYVLLHSVTCIRTMPYCGIHGYSAKVYITMHIIGWYASVPFQCRHDMYGCNIMYS